MPKVSVIIPTYNAMKYLPDTLESVLKQTFTNFEVLIINDGSSDHILEWSAKLLDPRVKLISQTNQGVSIARNTGIAHAQGEYIAFLDADDLWEPTKLEKQTSCLDNKPTVGLVYTWTILVDENKNTIGKIYASHAEGNVWQKLLETDEMCNSSSAMVRRCCFETVGVFDPNLAFAEDMDMWLRIAAIYPFAVVKETLTLYRQHSTNTTKNREGMIHGLRTLIEKTFQFAPLDLLHLRNRTYASINLGLAWVAIDECNYKKAIYFRQQAILHHPKIRYSDKFIRLSLAILLVRCFGSQGYEGVRSLTHFFRWQLLKVAR
ncbi:MAG: glycosyltransferase family 2 protein [Nostoc sp. LLA-1]|nr:glycosyltransferase family 2 protein [Cyanocohniella sp. LLY]